MCEKRLHQVTCDHCHLTRRGQYKGLAHSNCNLNYRDLYCIPIVFHNLSGFDAHFVIKDIAIAYKVRVDILPIIKEKLSYNKRKIIYINYFLHKTSPNLLQIIRKNVNLCFINSYKFLNTSLEKLASYLDKDKLKIIHGQNFSTLARRISIFSHAKAYFRTSTLTVSIS